ncbi:MAG: PEGA domain-containing protein [Woeseia sp.]|nr:PEGA domain-containing protein [Woeseia sp.]
MLFRIFSILVATLLASGCATITRGTSEAFAIETNPPGASATLSNGLACTTPCSIKVKRRGDFTVTLQKEGYETVTATVSSSIDGAGGAGMAGNVLVGGIIGAGVDAGTGAMHSHKPNPLSVTMVKLGDIETEMSATPSTVYDDLQKIDNLRKQGIISDSEFESEKAKLLGNIDADSAPEIPADDGQ